MGLSAGASMVAGIVGVLILMFASGPGGEGGAGLQPGGIFRARHSRPHRRLGRRARLDRQGTGDGRARDRHQPDRRRFDPRRGALHLRLRVSARRHQLRAGHGRPVRDHRAHQHDPRRRHHRQGGKARRIAVGWVPGHVPLSVHADPEHGGRRLPRHDPGTRRDGGEFPRLQRGAAILEASRAVRQGRAGRRHRAGSVQQFLHSDQPDPGADARDSRRRHLRHPAGRGHPAGIAARADAVHVEPGADLGLLHGPADRRRDGDDSLSHHDPVVRADHASCGSS